MHYINVFNISHTKPTIQTKPLKENAQTVSAPKFYTKTHTTFVTVTFADDSSPTPSFPPQDTPTSSDSNTFPWPIAHGIIPGVVYSHTPSPPLPSTGTTATPILRPSTPAPRRSNHPRPSPPDFLYPEPIVPQAVYEQHRKSMRHPHLPGSMGEGSVMWYSSYILETIICAVLVVGFVWAILACLVTFPPLPWDWRFMPWSVQSAKKKQETRPLDKPSKYVNNNIHEPQ
jgi:hypothetical protein